MQFAWAIDAPIVVTANVPVEFQRAFAGRRHGFGVYNPDGRLIIQAQVVPDHMQKIVHTFTKPGIYKIRCLEFCGAGHHLMTPSWR